jgi:CheY-like chemotaxis protein
MKDCKVLVVEDDQDIRELIADILTGEGFPVEQASNGAEALHKMKAGFAPDVVLTNLLMPVMDGYQLNAELKRHAGWSSIPTIVMTAGRAQPNALADVEAVLQKPVDLEHLLARVKKACVTKNAANS